MTGIQGTRSLHSCYIPTQWVHVATCYIPGPYSSSHVLTVGPMYLPYRYLDPWGYSILEVPKRAAARQAPEP